MQVDGYSLDAQKTELENYANYRQMTIVGEYSDEGFSGKNITGRPQFQQMMDDIESKKDNVQYVLVYKLSRFGRNAADVLNSLQTLQSNGANLICVGDQIDSSAAAGKLIISVMAAMAEMERENILAQTMAGRQQKARNGEWNGGFAPYGYRLEEGKLLIAEDEAEVIRIIFDKYAKTMMGIKGVAAWLNRHGYIKKVRQKGELPTFASSFVKGILDNPVYAGKIVYGRHKTVPCTDPKKKGKFHVVKNTEPCVIYEGKHEAIISEDLWNKVRSKRKANGNRPEKKEKDHKYILSGLLKCPCCGVPMYGTPNGKKRKADGTFYPTYYSYICRNRTQETGHTCSWGSQISTKIMDKCVRDMPVSLVEVPDYAEIIKILNTEKFDTTKLQQDLSRYDKELKKAQKQQTSIEMLLKSLDPSDQLYQKELKSLNNVLRDCLFTQLNLEQQIAECEKRIDNIKKDRLTTKSLYDYLLVFDEFYDEMTDRQKKDFMRLFIESIEIYPEKQKNGQLIKAIHFNVPVVYQGDLTRTISLPKETTVESVCLLSKSKAI